MYIQVSAIQGVTSLCRHITLIGFHVMVSRNGLICINSFNHYLRYHFPAIRYLKIFEDATNEFL